jgi:amino acid transporter
MPSPSLGPGPAGLPELQDLFSRIIKISVGLAFVALVVVLVMAGIKYITSSGEPKSIQSASQAIVWGLLGMLFLVIAWLILQLIHAFTGLDVTKFCISFSGCQ